jgi:ferredoxin
MTSQKGSQHSIHSHPTTQRMITSLISTSLWGFFETLILNVMHFIDRYLWSNFHTRFMRLIHHRFGGIITPFDASLETNPLNRNWENRTQYKIHTTQNGSKYLKKGQLTILPTQEIFNLLIRSNINPDVAICYCRDHQRKHGHQCELNAPLRTCLTLRLPQSISSIRESPPRIDQVKQKALYNLLMRCEQIGLVHQVVFYKRYNTYVICNCCPDCCEILSPLFHSIKEIKYHQKKIEKYNSLADKKQHSTLNSEELIQFKKLQKSRKMHEKGAYMDPVPLVARSAFIAVQDLEGECINCGKCTEHCYFGARIMRNGELEFKPNLCYGCGLCVSRCVNSVITLQKRSKPKLMSPLGIGIKHDHTH